MILGIMQDGGLPHIGCRCVRCSAVYRGAAEPEYVTSLAILDVREPAAKVWLIDATPDIKHQLNLLADFLGPDERRPGRLRPLDGIFITHAHMGHIGGLPQLGPEAMAVDGLRVWAAPGIVTMLNSTKLWKPLVRNLWLEPLLPNVPISLGQALTVTAHPVPHRDEWDAGTYAFRIQGPSRSILYLPDIDSWEQWSHARQQLGSVDVALVDAAFFSSGELGGRSPVQHPLIPHTIDLFAGLPCELILTHFNHTNPVLETTSQERQVIENARVRVARTGAIIPL